MINGFRATLTILAFATAAMTFVYTPAIAQTWREDPLVVESDHPYRANLAGLATRVSKPGATRIRVFFERIETENQWDWVEIYDASGRRIQRYTGTQTNVWSPEVTGDSLEIRLTTDSGDNFYGFRASRLAYLGAAAPKVERIEAWASGRALRSDDVLRLSAHGEPGDHLDLEVRAYSARGDLVAAFAFDPRVRSSTGETPITVERIASNQVRLHAGAQANSNVPIQIYDANRPELAFKFLVTVGRATPSAPRVDWIEAWYDGARVRSGDVLTLGVHGTDEAHADLEIRAYSRTTRRQVTGYPLNLVVRSSTGFVPVSIEDIGNGWVRLHAGETPAENVPIQIYDSNRPELNVKLQITLEAPDMGPVIDTIGIFVPDGEDFRPIQPGEVVELTVHDMGNDHLPFQILALDPTGHAIDPDLVDLGVQLNVVAWYGAVEAECHHMHIFHAGVMPAEGIRIVAYDRTNPRNQAVLAIRTVKPMESEHGHDHGHGDHHGEEHPPEPAPRAWAQIGETYPVPDWARARKHYIDCIYMNGQGTTPIYQVRVLPRQDILIEYARLDFQDGTMETLLSNARVRAFEGVVVDVPGASQAKSVAKITVRVRAEGGTEILCYVLTNG